MSINKKFADIVHNSLWEVDELCDDILLEEGLKEPRIFTDQLPPMVFPFGYMIISSTFAYYEDEEEDGNQITE
tara:strand:+ start:177 stop:395 length:219 start_codon:yes stop_codon:yes gene_type:complete